MYAMKIILIGYMAGGKTSVGKILSEKMNLPFIDLDHSIEKVAGMTISEIFQTKGEIYFRKLENRVLKEVLANPGEFVLATGGGTPCYGDSLAAMHQTENGVTIYLRTPIRVLAERLFQEKTNRPLVSHLHTLEEVTEFVGIHVFERARFYTQADSIIDTETHTPEEIATIIQKKMN